MWATYFRQNKDMIRARRRFHGSDRILKILLKNCMHKMRHCQGGAYWRTEAAKFCMTLRWIVLTRLPGQQNMAVLTPRKESGCCHKNTENLPIQLVQVVTSAVVSLPERVVARQQAFLSTTFHLLKQKKNWWQNYANHTQCWKSPVHLVHLLFISGRPDQRHTCKQPPRLALLFVHNGP